MLRSSKNVTNPVFVSIGHMIDLDTAVAVVRKSSIYRIPEPIRLADKASRRSVLENNMPSIK